MSQAAFLLTLGFLLRREYEDGWEEMKDYDPHFPGLLPILMEGLGHSGLLNLFYELRETYEWRPIFWPFRDF